MNGLLPLGIPLSELTQLLTVGLSLGDPPTPTPPSSSGGGISIDLPVTIVSNEDGPFTSNAFAIPSGATRLTWQVLGTVSDIELQGSLDFTHFASIDSMTAAGVETIQAGPTSIRIVITTGTGVSVIVTAKREML